MRQANNLYIFEAFFNRSPIYFLMGIFYLTIEQKKEEERIGNKKQKLYIFVEILKIINLFDGYIFCFDISRLELGISNNSNKTFYRLS